MNDSILGNKYVLMGVAGLFAVLIGTVVVLLVQRQNAVSNPAAATTPTALSSPAGAAGRASGYKGAELMPAPPGAAGMAGTAAMGTAPAAPPAHASGYKGAELMPAPPAVR